MTSTTTTCPKCHQLLTQGMKFCANCGRDVSGVWSDNPALGGTIAVEVDPNVDALGQMLSSATLGDYDIYGELGRGGMAAVYLGLDLALNRKVAIKTMLPELVQREGMVARFKREAQTAAALSHPHIIQIFTVKENAKLVYFVMKFIEGRSLESVINDKGKVPVSMAQTIMSQVGSALDYAHRKHVIHRDIKPANIMIDEDGWAIVTDFGIAKVQEAQNLTATGTAIGTPHYMSPEQFHNKSVTGASDQYSMGVVLYEMLTGKKPFDGNTYPEIITQVLFEQAPDIKTISPDVPDHVAGVVTRMMAKDPADRFPDLDAAVHALGQPGSKKEGDVVRTQMISLAKSGPQKKVRMSVPMSPIPETRKRQPAAATAVEPTPAATAKKKPAKPRPVETGGSAGGRWLAAVLVLGLLGGGGYYYYTNVRLSASSGPTVSQAGANTTPSGVDAAAGDPASQPSAKAPGSSQTATSAVDSSQAALLAAQAELNRIREAAIREEAKRVQDSIARAAAARRAAARLPAAGTLAGNAAGKAPLSAGAPPRDQSVQTSVPAATATSALGYVRIGTRTPGAYLYVNGKVDGVLTRVRWVPVAAGTVALQIRGAGGCQAWDSTFAVRSGDSVTVGFRQARC